MTGIAELFEELNGYERYQLDLFLYLLRRQVAADESNREYEKTPQRKAYKRTWYRDYAKKRRATDPEWASKLRARQRENNRTYRERKRAARAT